ncbi:MULTISPECIES: response regulator [Flavobacterium]|jgi:CheY-like chemotaxis protein|uniref:response regulator n=1 Tax=Flavobacterium TaxID=237 RepID=UPI00105E41E4|nr:MULTISPECIES: response regulator [Flavobacterium]KAF2335083.1 response regulator [Flavobacterium daemonense]MDQ6469224.1 response regulator [Flavobacterium sp. LHD-80]MTH14161.1 response regulator [Flavobacterium sp. LC2016-01]TDP01538.1 response regulator receiver domain-containing protein [Flavobacterium sp. 245]
MQKNALYILLADDDEDDRLFFKDAFEEIKIQTNVDFVHDGMQLMDHLNNLDNKLPDILFLDLNMPKKTGKECLIEIKKTERLKNIIIAIYSTSSSEEDIEDTFIQGANIYIKKPSDFNTLKKIINEVVTVNWHYHTSGLNRDNFLLRLK